jgi:hypothetical protein
MEGFIILKNDYFRPRIFFFVGMSNNSEKKLPKKGLDYPYLISMEGFFFIPIFSIISTFSKVDLLYPFKKFSKE